MTTDKSNNNDVLGYWSVISLAGIMGIFGGFLFGVWDSLTVLIDRGFPVNTLSKFVYLSLYSVAIYTIVGCLGMVIIGLFSGIVINVGKYQVSKLQLIRIFIVILVLLVVSILLSGNLMYGNIIDIVESTLIGIFSGIGTAALGIYIFTYFTGKGIDREKLIAIFISLFISLLILVYSGLIINEKLLPAVKIYQPVSLLANIGLLILVSLVAVVLYTLSIKISKRYSSGRIRRTGYTFLVTILCAFIAISIIMPFNSNEVPIAASGAAIGKPNILWIVMDTARADHLSCYGYYRNTTPNIDRIASEGILYEHAISAAPWTLPSHASMFTGTFPSKHGTDSDQSWLRGDFITVAEVLRANGYRTYEYTNNKFVGPAYNLSQGFDIVKKCWLGRIEAGSELADHLKIRSFIREIQNRLCIDDGATRTNEFVRKWIAESNQSKDPFFIFINYMEVHYPYHPPRDYVVPYLGKGINMAELLSVNQDEDAYNLGKVRMSDEDFRILNGLYDGEQSYLDFRIGQLLDYMRELGILDNTILIITADHGENLGDHQLLGHHFCVYDTLVHVPLIIRYPDSFKAGLRIDNTVQTIDIFPTILDITHIDWVGDEQIQGHSLLRDREEPNSLFAISESTICRNIAVEKISKNIKHNNPLNNRTIKAVRVGNYKYIWGSDGYDELYNLQIDPDETNNLIEIEPEKASEMKEILINWFNSFEPYKPKTSLLFN